MGEWGYRSIILALVTRWRWVLNFTLLPIYLLVESTWYRFEMRLDGSLSRCGWCESSVFQPIAQCYFDRTIPGWLLRYDLSENSLWEVGYKVLTAVVMNASIFWDIANCSPYLNRGFGGKYRLHLQGRKWATCYKLVSCSANFRSRRWRWYIPPKRLFTYRLNGDIFTKDGNISVWEC
jgi:hypothetical protein